MNDVRSKDDLASLKACVASAILDVPLLSVTTINSSSSGALSGLVHGPVLTSNTNNVMWWIIGVNGSAKYCNPRPVRLMFMWRN